MILTPTVSENKNVLDLKFNNTEKRKMVTRDHEVTLGIRLPYESEIRNFKLFLYKQNYSEPRIESKSTQRKSEI